LSQNISYTLNLSEHKTYNRYSSQDGRSYHDFRAIGPRLAWVGTAIDSGWYDQENDSWKPGVDPDSVWLWYYTQEGWYYPATDTSQGHWDNVYNKQRAYNDRWYDTGSWEVNADSTDIFYAPFDLDGYLWDVANLPEHRSDKYKGDIDEWAYHPTRDEFGYFTYNFCPRWYGRSSTSYTVDFDLNAQVGKYNQVKAGFYWRRDFLNHTDIQFVNTRPYSDHYEKEPVNIAAYLQDELKYKKLSLNAGLRYDYFKPRAKGDTISHSERQWSPRLRIAFVVFDNTLLYANYGRFSQVIQLVGSPDKTILYEVGLRHTFTPGLAGQVLAYHKRECYSPYLISETVSPQNTSYAIYNVKNSAKVKGIDLTITKSASRYLSGSLGYSYLDAKGTGPANWYRYIVGTNTQILSINRPLEFDVTHSFKANLNLNLPEGLGPALVGFKPLSDLNINLQFTHYTGVPCIHLDSKGNLGISGSVRFPSTQQTDLKIVKGFKITGGLRCGLFLDVRNLFNVENVVNVYPDNGKPDDDDDSPIWDPSQWGNYADHRYSSGWECYQAAYKDWYKYVKDPANYGIPRIVRMGIWVKL